MRLATAVFLTMCGVLLAPVFPQAEAAAAANDPSKRVFEIPVYPGTVPFNENPRFERWHAPFGTSLRVYRTRDGEPFEKEKVISFFRESLASKGWKDAIFKRQGDEGYLGLRVDLFEDLADGTRIQLSGEFRLWVAPQDGIYTILLDQWRLSSLNQGTMNYLSNVRGSLDGIGTKHGYRVQKVYSDGEWARDFENEFLIDRVRFTFIAKEASGPHASDGQMINLFILTYRDPAIAEDEAKRLRPSPASSADGTILTLPSRVVSLVVVKNSTVFVIRDDSGKQAESVTQIATELRKH